MSTTIPSSRRMSSLSSDSNLLFRPRPVFQRRRDQVFIWATRIAVFFSAFLLLWIALEIGIQSLPAISKFGLSFFWSTTWDPVEDIYGAWPQIYGTLVTSLIALMEVVPPISSPLTSTLLAQSGSKRWVAALR